MSSVQIAHAVCACIEYLKSHPSASEKLTARISQDVEYMGEVINQRGELDAVSYLFSPFYPPEEDNSLL